MAYNQYTQCISAENYSGKTNYTLAAIGAIVVLLVTGLFNPYSLVALLVTLNAYCYWWLNERLICLGGERCAIGLLGNVEPPQDKSFPGSLDTDYSINLLLAPHNIQELPPGYPASVPPPGVGENKTEYYEKKFKEALHQQIADDGIQGNLIREQSTTGSWKTVFGTKTYGFEGSFSTVASSTVLHRFQPYLHCEFEGGGIRRLYEAAKAALAFATAAAVVCSIPVLGWLACLVLSAISLIITIAGFFNGLNDTAEPSVFDPKTGITSATLHNLEDILFVRGDWVYDTAHEGWNEIHPIKDCQLVAKATRASNDQIDWENAIAPYMIMKNRWSYDPSDPKKIVKTSGPVTVTDWQDWVASWCSGVREGSAPLTIAAQGQPENQWETHPEVDGCRPAATPPPPLH